MNENKRNDLFTNLKNLEKLLQKETRKETQPQTQKQQKKQNNANNQVKNTNVNDSQKDCQIPSHVGNQRNKRTKSIPKKPKNPAISTPNYQNSPYDKGIRQQKQYVPRKLYYENEFNSLQTAKPIVPQKYLNKPQSSISRSPPKMHNQIPNRKSPQKNTNKTKYSYTQLGLLCNYFIKWMKRCTESMNAHQRMKSSQSNPHTELTVEDQYTADTNKIISSISKIDHNQQNMISKDSNSNSVEETCQMNLEETSPPPKTDNLKAIPSIGESDFRNPNSADFHYNSYDVSEKSLSLLPPQGEGEVTEFHPSKFQ